MPNDVFYALKLILPVHHAVKMNITSNVHEVPAFNPTLYALLASVWTDPLK